MTVEAPDWDGTCATCARPGACCSGFTLSHPILLRPETEEEALKALAEIHHRDCEGRPVTGVPFVPLGWCHKPPEGDRLVKTAERQGPDDYRTYACPALGADGRCTIYATRPATCSSFVPGSDALCVMWTPERAAALKAAAEPEPDIMAPDAFGDG